MPPFVFAKIVHVEVAMLFEPVLVGLDPQRPHQPEAALAVGEDGHPLGVRRLISSFNKLWKDS